MWQRPHADLFEVEGRPILLVDDVLYTGRTTRAVINELFDYGRPARRATGRAGGPGRARAAHRAAAFAAAWRQPGDQRQPAAGTEPAASAFKTRESLDAESKRNPQLNKHGELIHLLSIEGLPREGHHAHPRHRGSFLSVNDREVKKVPLLRGKSVFNLFFENSTRTRTTFEIAAKRLSADVINLDIARGPARPRARPLLDTIANPGARCTPTCSSCATRIRRALPRSPSACARMCTWSTPATAAMRTRRRGLLDMYTIRHSRRTSQPDGGHRRRHLHSRVARSTSMPGTSSAPPRDARRRPEDAGAGRPGARWACASATT